MIIIGLSGKKRTGKDTVADMIETLPGKDSPVKVFRLGFADSLKEEVCKEFEVSRSFLEDNKETFRPILQSWGELRRKIQGEDYWINKLLLKLTRLSDTNNSICLITDVRYKNEANALRKYSGTLLFRMTKYVPFLSLDKHSSEVDLDDYKHFDEIIENNGSLDDLFKRVSDILRQRKIKI